MAAKRTKKRLFGGTSIDELKMPNGGKPLHEHLAIPHKKKPQSKGFGSIFNV